MSACANRPSQFARPFELNSPDGCVSSIRDIDNAWPNRCLHLEVRVVGLKNSEAQPRAAICDPCLRAALVAPGPLRGVSASRFRRCEVEASAFEPSGGGDVGERVLSRLDLQSGLRRPGVVRDLVRVGEGTRKKNGWQVEHGKASEVVDSLPF